MRTVYLATRGSRLALRQTEEVLALLRGANPERSFDLKTVRTRGDVARDVPLDQLPRGAFAKEVQEAVLQGVADLAVHSLKDLPTQPVPGLTLAAVARRADPRDALVSHHGETIETLPQGARVGTGSLRRTAQLLALRPDLNVLPVRGNVDTRLEKLRQGQYDALVLAAAGLLRLGLERHISHYLDPLTFVPSAGQGALALEARADDQEVLRLAQAVHDATTWAAVAAERAFEEALGVGCRLPAGAYAQVGGEQLSLVAVVASEDGRRVLKDTEVGPASAPEHLGRRLALRMLKAGAGELVG
ncbi:MAG: hydroxymethylbilane synthase [Chloroflexi bacterium]|nr:hydroxymethylbilane synthase [Chloroflexota bacterium]